jgi:hypothetical protein
MRERPRDAQPTQVSAEIALDELREFLEADLSGARVDPKFKEELRQMLWDFVRNRAERVDGSRRGG